MDITLINGNTISSDDVVFNSDALNNGTSPVFVQSSTGADLDNLLKESDMYSMFGNDGWSYDQWNAWRAAHPISGTPVPFQNQQGTIPGTSITQNLANQNWFDVAANYYLDTFNTPVKKAGSVVLAVIGVYVIVQLLKSGE